VDSRGSYSFEHEEREKFLQSAPQGQLFLCDATKEQNKKVKYELRARE